MSEVPAVPVATASPTAFATREQVEAKLLHHLELTFGHPFNARDPITSCRTNGNLSHLITIVCAHFHLNRFRVLDVLFPDIKSAVAESDTIGEMITKICEMLNIPNSELF